MKKRFACLFLGEGVWGDDELERAMRLISLKRDPNALVALLEEDLECFERRKDISDLCKELTDIKAVNPDC